MDKKLLTVTRKILFPQNNSSKFLIYRDAEIVLSMSTPYSSELCVEIYYFKDSYEWRIINKSKVVLYDSVDAMYGVPEIALVDALLFAQVESL